MHAFHENPNRIHFFCRPLKIFEASKTNSVDPDSLIWVHNVCLYAYFKYTFTDAVILLAF